GKIKNVSLSLGLQQTVWGQADGLRVLDVINPLDYREFILEDFLDSRRPLWMLRSDISLTRGSLQLIWVPYFASARLPGPENEFGIGPSFGLELIRAAFGELPIRQFSFNIQPTQRPAYRLRSSQGGTRYGFNLGKWDLTVNYFYGWEDIPTPYVRGIIGLPIFSNPRVTVAPRHDRKEVFGGTGTTNFGPVVLRMEAGWNRRKANAVKVSSASSGFERFGQFSGVAGLDYSPRTWLWLSGQYFFQFTSAPQRLLLFPRNNHFISVYARSNFFGETLKPELFVLAGLNQRQYMIRPRITRSFRDHWSASLGADFFGGSPVTPFGFFNSRDRVVLELAWRR
ncbi:MAG TPA: DUF1302 family protein, partial [Acidobacteriota bacterium]|nr:DUF1302 family protein [Acidobacteriota bacterium]